MGLRMGFGRGAGVSQPRVDPPGIIPEEFARERVTPRGARHTDLR